jgi:hypothetical protein
VPSALCPGYSDSGPTRRGSRHGEPYLRHCRSSRLTEHYWQVHLRSTVTFGFDRVQNTAAEPETAFSNSYYMSGNLIWNSAGHLNVGVEFLDGWQVLKNNSQGMANRIQVTAQMRSLQQKTTIGVYHPNEPVRVLHGCSGTKRTRGLSVSMACFLAPIVGSPIAFQAYRYLAAEREVAKNILLEPHARSVRGGVS